MTNKTTPKKLAKGQNGLAYCCCSVSDAESRFSNALTPNLLTHCVPTLAENRKLNHKHYLTLTINVQTLHCSRKSVFGQIAFGQN